MNRRFVPIIVVTVALLAGLGLLSAQTAPSEPAYPLPPQVAPGAQLTLVCADAKYFFESPVWDPAAKALYVDAYAKVDRLARVDGPDKLTFMPGTDGVGGAIVGIDGRLLAADCDGHRILSYALGKDGPTDPKTLAADKTWHQPNDLCQTPGGDIYFTDPDFKDKKAGAVYHLSPAGKVARVVTGMGCPNGIVCSADGKSLFVSDSNERKWWTYPIRPDGSLGEAREFFAPKTDSKANPDGMAVDEKGNIYATGLGGVWVVSPAGEILGFIKVPEFCSNVAFGGPEGKTLYVTCSKKVYSLAMTVAGQKIAPK